MVVLFSFTFPKLELKLLGETNKQTLIYYVNDWKQGRFIESLAEGDGRESKSQDAVQYKQKQI